MNQLRYEIEKFITVTDQEWKLITRNFTYQKIPKGEIIHNAGEIFNSIYYILEGVARSYVIDLDGKDFTWQLYFKDDSSAGKNHFIDDSVSYYEQVPSLLHFETLEDCEFAIIKIANLDRLFNRDKKWQYLARMYKLSNLYAPMYKRSLSIMTENAQDRYKRLLQEHPNIFDKVKAYHIASYLGIAPQTLSKIRKKEYR